MAMSGPKQPITNMPAAIAITTNEIAAWCTMKRMPSPISCSTACTLLLADSIAAGRPGDVARTIATEPMSAADPRKLAKSMA